MFPMVNGAVLLAGLGLGLALAGAPGPVQAVILAEGIRGGVGRALRAMAGANLTFGALLLAAALGLSVVSPGGIAVRIITLAGGAFLAWMAVDAFRSARPLAAATDTRRSLPPAARGSLAVILNPGAWIFLATVAASLYASAQPLGAPAGPLLAALALICGIAIGDFAVVLLGGVGLRRVDVRLAVWIQRVLALVLLALGFGLLVSGIVG